MKSKTLLIPALAVSALALGLTATKSEAAPVNNLVRLAHEIEDNAVDLKSEFRIHYRHSSAYRHLLHDIAEIIEKAEHIDELAHDPHSSLRHIRIDLGELDELAHHLHRIVDGVEDGYYGGHVDGDTRHVHRLLTSLNGSIHALENAVAHYGRPPVHDHGHGHREPSAREQIIGGVLRIIADRHGRHGHGH